MRNSVIRKTMTEDENSAKYPKESVDEVLKSTQQAFDRDGGCLLQEIESMLNKKSPKDPIVRAYFKINVLGFLLAWIILNEFPRGTYESVADDLCRQIKNIIREAN